MKKIAIWTAQTRAPFLLLSVLLVGIGGAAARADGAFDVLRFALALVGVTLAHVAVNLFNELSDHETGIDLNTRRTPFSGGSGSLQRGDTTPGAVRAAAWGSLALALAAGIALALMAGWEVLAFAAAGGAATVFYTSRLSRFVMGEIAAGLCLGTLVVLGTYFSLAETITAEAIWLSIPPGILTSLLLLLNEFPDAEADRRGGRRHIVIVLGYHGAAIVYAVSLAACYVAIAAGAWTGALPRAAFIALFTLPLGVKAAVTALAHGADHDRMVPALGANVGVVLGTDLLLAVALLV